MVSCPLYDERFGDTLIKCRQNSQGKVAWTLKRRKKMAWMWLLVLVLVVVAVIVKLRRSSRIFIIRQHLQRSESPFQNPPSPSRPHIQRRDEVEHMVCCEECGIYIPDSEALVHSGKIFCCREHKAAYFSKH